MTYAFDVTFKRMSESTPRHVLQLCTSMERAIELTKEQYPGCLVINALMVPC